MRSLNSCRRSSFYVALLVLFVAATGSWGSPALPKRLPVCPSGPAGRWVRDNSLPFYTGLDCPIIRSQQNCQRNERRNMQYQKRRWIPFGSGKICSYSKLSRHSFSFAMRGMRIAVVGESPSKNLGASFRCIMDALTPDWLKKYSTNRDDFYDVSYLETKSWAPLLIERHKAFNVTFCHVFDKFLVRNVTLSDNTTQLDIGVLGEPLRELLSLKFDAIFLQSSIWLLGKNPVRYLFRTKPISLSRFEAYKIIFKTVANEVLRAGFKGKLIVLSVSPSHYQLPKRFPHSKQCETNSLMDATQVKNGFLQNKPFFDFQRNFSHSVRPYKFLDVTTMSNYRPDGHVQNWFLQGGAVIAKNSTYAKDDCTHWCEGGVTDAWVEAMYNFLR